MTDGVRGPRSTVGLWAANGSLLLIIGLVVVAFALPHVSSSCGGPSSSGDCPHPVGNLTLTVIGAVIAALGALALVVPLTALGVRLAHRIEAYDAAQQAAQKPL